MFRPVCWFLLIFVVLRVVRNNWAHENNFAELPHCNDIVPPAVFISTLDGKFTALNMDGEFMWDLETGPGPLLISNIHKLELTNNGQWIRIIPSLSGSLYKFNGKTVDAIPITADNLLKSSFVYSGDLVIAGGREVRTYGLSMVSGENLYECTLLGCKNKTEHPTDYENMVVVERSTITVRAHESRSGSERWNFSVGLHNIRIPELNCINYNAEIMSLNLTAILPKGQLNASNDKQGFLWSYNFNSPIVHVWKFNGKDLITVDLFDSTKPAAHGLSPAIYLGIHNKQPYIHESGRMQNALQYLHHATNNPNMEVVDSVSIARLPWKPVGATDLSIIPAENNLITSQSILYTSEYTNGNGYYLFTEKDLETKNNMSCNNTEYILSNTNDATYTFAFFINWWKEVCIIAGTVFLVNLYFFRQVPNVQRNPLIPLHESIPSVNLTIPLPVVEKERTISESSNVPFKSRFVEEFDTVRCLGRGGFGIVFEVKQKIDKCGYAIKRITLPDETTSRERVMREVRSLARLDNVHIVRYFNSWIEEPPLGWQKEHDIPWTQDMTEQTTDQTRPPPKVTYRQNISTIIDVTVSTSSMTGSSYSGSRTEEMASNNTEEFSDDGIIFQEDSQIDTMNDTKAIAIDDSESICFEDSRRNENETDDDTDTADEEKEEVNIPPVKNRQPSNNPPVFLYIQMQLCQKDNLKEWLLANQDRNYEVVLSFFKQIVDAVHYIHEKTLIHRDLKPGNIFFSIDGTIKVGDFGLVTEMQECDITDSFTGDSSFKSHTKDAGTRLYMSPEQIDRHAYNFKVDIYSLGMIFFELLVPFGTDMERYNTLLDLRNGQYPETFSEKHPEETQLLKLMLSKDPTKRPTTQSIKESHPLLNFNNHK